jgi:hypothetical protein
MVYNRERGERLLKTQKAKKKVFIKEAKKK